jgi:hypothetical protein
MTRRTLAVALIVCLSTAAAIHAGTVYHMKCQAKPAKDAATGKTAKPCGYESSVTFGGGMFFDQICGYCRSCKKFVYLNWTRENLPQEMKARMRIKVTPRPKPLGEVWDCRTGEVLTIHACPHCKGPFLEIKKRDDLNHCPACNKAHFVVDESKPRIAVD